MKKPTPRKKPSLRKKTSRRPCWVIQLNDKELFVEDDCGNITPNVQFAKKFATKVLGERFLLDLLDSGDLNNDATASIHTAVVTDEFSESELYFMPPPIGSVWVDSITKEILLVAHVDHADIYVYEVRVAVGEEADGDVFYTPEEWSDRVKTLTRVEVKL